VNPDLGVDVCWRRAGLGSWTEVQITSDVQCTRTQEMYEFKVQEIDGEEVLGLQEWGSYFIELEDGTILA